MNSAGRANETATGREEEQETADNGLLSMLAVALAGRPQAISPISAA